MAIFFCLQKVSLGGTTTSFFALDLNLLAINVPQDPDPDSDPDDPFKFIAKMDGEKGTNGPWFKFFSKVSFVDIGEDVGDTVYDGDFVGTDDREEKLLSSVSAK